MKRSFHSFLLLALSGVASATALPVADISTDYEIPKSTYQELDPYTTRDPFCPIGYKRPAPQGANEGVKPTIDWTKLKINTVLIGVESSAILDTGEIIEPGGEFKFKVLDKDGKPKATVAYKVLRITETAVTILYDGEEIEVKPKSSDLDKFLEKEE